MGHHRWMLFEQAEALARSDKPSSSCPEATLCMVCITNKEESSESTGLGRPLLLRQPHSHLLTGAYRDGGSQVWPERAETVAAQGRALRRLF